MPPVPPGSAYGTATAENAHIYWSYELYNTYLLQVVQATNIAQLITSVNVRIFPPNLDPIM